MNAPDVEHALRNHLAIILGYAELLVRDTPPDDPRRGDCEEILKAARSAVALVRIEDERQ